MGIGVQELTYFNPQRSGETSSEGQKKGDFRARIALQDEHFFVVILNTFFRLAEFAIRLNQRRKNGS